MKTGGTKTIPSARHESAIPGGLPRNGFAAQLRAHTGVSLGTQCRFVPDAFHFDVDGHRLTIVESIATNPISERKLGKFRLLRDLLRALGWRMRVVVVHLDFQYPFSLRTGEIVSPAWRRREAVNAIGRGQSIARPHPRLV